MKRKQCLYYDYILNEFCPVQYNYFMSINMQILGTHNGVECRAINFRVILNHIHNPPEFRITKI